MTNEEAAKCIERIRFYMEGDECWTDAEFEAMDMAIEALRSAPSTSMSDPIERRAAIDVVKRLMGDCELSRTVQTGLHLLLSAQPDVPDTNVGDIISRQAAIDALWKARCEYEDETEKQFQELEDLDLKDWIINRIFVQNMSDIDRQTILNLPSARQEIIHCRECRHWQSEEYIGNNNVHTLNIASLPCKNWLTAGDWHCGSAERREE